MPCDGDRGVTWGMTFDQVLPHIRDRNRSARRAGWNGASQFIRAQYPDRQSKMTQPYFYIRNQQGGLVPWLASQGDLFASDWELL